MTEERAESALERLTEAVRVITEYHRLSPKVTVFMPMYAYPGFERLVKAVYGEDVRVVRLPYVPPGEMWVFHHTKLTGPLEVYRPRERGPHYFTPDGVLPVPDSVDEVPSFKNISVT